MSEVKKVLVVEDDADVRQGLVVLLGREFEVIAAEDSISGLIAARREQPDAIVLDLGLPGGDGLVFLERLQDIAELSETPTYVVTGRDGDEVDSRALALGARAVLRKPADAGELIDAIRAGLTSDAAPRKRILVVDDDADTRAALAVRLRSEDYVVALAGDGASALMAARKHKPDLVLLDLGLPCGDGISVLTRLRAIEGMEQLPVVVLSGRDASEAVGPAVEAGATSYLEKPADEVQLLTAVRSAL